MCSLLTYAVLRGADLEAPVLKNKLLDEMLKYALTLLSQVFLAHKHVILDRYKDIKCVTFVKWPYIKGELIYL